MVSQKKAHSADHVPGQSRLDMEFDIHESRFCTCCCTAVEHCAVLKSFLHEHIVWFS